MTTIAWDGTFLCADRMASQEGMFRSVQKIFKIKDNLYLAAAGCHQDTLLAVKYLTDGGDLPTLSSEHFVGIIVRDGRAYRVEEKLMESEILEPFYALGEGRDYATAAMALGKTAYDGVELAAKYCLYTGLGIDKVFPGGDDDIPF